MGQFSWIYSDTNQAMLDGVYHNSYLLVPELFSKEYGPYILEECYDGYGMFAGRDIYELVALWNREFVSKNPDLLLYRGTKLSSYSWYPFFSDLSLSVEDVLTKWKASGAEDPNTYRFCELRQIGIDIACYDDENRAMQYPIKIVERPVPYADAYPSDADPNQGRGDAW